MVELIAVLKESLRKQAFSVVLLICACGGLWLLRNQDKAELRIEITELKANLHSCMESKESLLIRIAGLESSISMLQRR